MHRLIPLLCALTAAHAIPDTMLFVRDGQVMLLRAGETKSVQAIGKDPGWEYVLPTWTSPGEFVTMRLKGGQVLRSHSGLVSTGGKLPVAPQDISWLGYAGGAYSLGVAPLARVIAYTKVARRAEDLLDVFLTTGMLNSEWDSAMCIMKGCFGDVGTPQRLRFSRDGQYVTVPTFPSDVSSLISVYDLIHHKYVTPNWADYDWCAQHNGDADLSTVAWLPDGRVALASMLTGIYLYDSRTQTVRALEKWEQGQGIVHELTASADGQRLYYDFTSWAEDKSQPEIRMLDLQGNRTVILRNASSPDVMPPGEGAVG